MFVDRHPAPVGSNYLLLRCCQGRTQICQQLWTEDTAKESHPCFQEFIRNILRKLLDFVLLAFNLEFIKTAWSYTKARWNNLVDCREYERGAEDGEWYLHRDNLTVIIFVVCIIGHIDRPLNNVAPFISSEKPQIFKQRGFSSVQINFYLLNPKRNSTFFNFSWRIPLVLCPGRKKKTSKQNSWVFQVICH